MAEGAGGRCGAVLRRCWGRTEALEWGGGEISKQRGDQGGMQGSKDRLSAQVQMWRSTEVGGSTGEVEVGCPGRREHRGAAISQVQQL